MPQTAARRFRRLAVALLLLAAAPLAAAIQPGRWAHTTEADFEPGEVEGTVVTNLGDIKLAAATETLDELPEGVTIIYDIESLTFGGGQANRATYIAAGPEGKLLKIEDGKAIEVRAFEDEQVFCLAEYRSQLLIGVSGEKARVVALNKMGEFTTLYELPEGERFIWDIVATNPKPGHIVDHSRLFFATGPNGKLFHTGEEAGQLVEVLDTAQANVLCLAAGPGGTVYAGTDTDGLIYRLTAQADGSYAAFIAYDAPEPEIGALLVMPDGTVYAGTADAEQARPGRMEQADDAEQGRPEGDAPALDDIDDAPAPDEVDAATGPQSADGDAGDAAPDEAAPRQAKPAQAAEAADEDPGDEAVADRDAADPVTEADRDALRELIRQRLLAARKTGKIKPTSARAAGGKPRATRVARAATGESAEGNAVYRLDTRGFVTPVFRDSVVIHRLAAAPAQDNRHALYIATGAEGQVYRVEPEAGETAVLLDLDAKHALAMATAGDTLMLATAEPATLVTLEAGVAKRGVYTSDILDAEQISLFGTLNITADVPAGASVMVETRSGNVNDPEVAAWSDWSQAAVFMPDAQTSALQPREVTIDSPPARFLQYRLTLTSDGSASPAVGKVELAYVMPNRSPKLDSISAAYPKTTGDKAPGTNMNIEWEATDANGDRLLHSLAYQPAGSDKWLTIATDLADACHTWDTARVPDGRYTLRVTTSDRLDNPGDMARTAARLSDPVLIDNTPPAIADLAIDVKGDTATVSGKAADAYAPIASIAYSVDDDELDTPILPTDLIYDSTRETFVATILGLSPGPHVVTVRVKDARGNTTQTPVMFDVE